MSDCLQAVLDELVDEHHRSIVKHGLWNNYSEFDVHRAISDEFHEYTGAVISGDIAGEHGQRAELLQLANVAIKGYLRLLHVPDDTPQGRVGNVQG